MKGSTLLNPSLELLELSSQTTHTDFVSDRINKYFA